MRLDVVVGRIATRYNAVAGAVVLAEIIVVAVAVAQQDNAGFEYIAAAAAAAAAEQFHVFVVCAERIKLSSYVESAMLRILLMQYLD